MLLILLTIAVWIGDIDLPEEAARPPPGDRTHAAATSEGDRHRGMEAGFYRYLTRPVKVDELIDAIESLLVLDA